MKISRLFASVGKYGTVAVEASFAGIFGIGALIFRHCVVDPVRNDTRAELVERGFTLEEIKEAEGSAAAGLLNTVRTMIGDRDDRRLHEPEYAEFTDVSNGDSRPQFNT